jgi:ribosomal protein S11
MPKYIDYHSMPLMSPEQLKKLTGQIKSTIDSKKPDKFGVTQLNVFMASGEAWGYSDAPTAEAVVKAHAAIGIKIGVKDVTEVTPIA